MRLDLWCGMGAIALMAVTAAPAAAMPGQVGWVGVRSGLAWPPAELGFGDGVSGEKGWRIAWGGLVGVRVWRDLALEGSIGVAAADQLGGLRLVHGLGGVSWFLPALGPMTPLLSTGAGGIRAQRDAAPDSDTFAWSAGGGLAVPIGDRLGVRLDARRLAYRVLSGEERAARPQMELLAAITFGLPRRPAPPAGS